jgi:hypothetical protein
LSQPPEAIDIVLHTPSESARWSIASDNLEAQMALFVVTYDLINGKDYKTLIDELKRLGGFKPALSVWFVDVTSQSSAELRNHLKNFVDPDDRVVVVEFSKRPAHILAFQGTNDWIEQHC